MALFPSFCGLYFWSGLLVWFVPGFWFSLLPVGSGLV